MEELGASRAGVRSQRGRESVRRPVPVGVAEGRDSARLARLATAGSGADGCSAPLNQESLPKAVNLIGGGERRR